MKNMVSKTSLSIIALTFGLSSTTHSLPIWPHALAARARNVWMKPRLSHKKRPFAFRHMSLISLLFFASFFRRDYAHSGV